MTTEESISKIINLEKNKVISTKQAVRPKFLRLANVQIPIASRGEKKNKFKVSLY